MHEGGFLGDAGEPAGLLHERVVKDECCTHMHIYAWLARMRQPAVNRVSPSHAAVGAGVQR